MTMPGKMKTAIALVALAALAAALWLSGERTAHAPRQDEFVIQPTRGRPERFETRFSAMGTDARVAVEAPSASAARPFLMAAAGAIESVETLMSTFREESEVSRLNRYGAEREVALSAETVTVLRTAREFSRLSEGAFDVTYAPLRTLWREAAGSGRVPDDELVRQTLRRVGWQKLEVGEGSGRFLESGMKVDLGGIAKGYAVDLAAEAMIEAGAEAGLVDVGGDIRLFGLPAGEQHWRIGVRSPEGGVDVTILQLHEAGVATSGDYARGFRIGDEWFSHIVDPRSGRPVEHMASVTVVAPDAMTADALSTTLSVVGAEPGLELVESLPEVECMLLVREPDGSLSRHLSSGFGRFLAE